MEFLRPSGMSQACFVKSQHPQYVGNFYLLCCHEYSSREECDFLRYNVSYLELSYGLCLLLLLYSVIKNIAPGCKRDFMNLNPKLIVVCNYCQVTLTYQRLYFHVIKISFEEQISSLLNRLTQILVSISTWLMIHSVFIHGYRCGQKCAVIFFFFLVLLRCFLLLLCIFLWI